MFSSSAAVWTKLHVSSRVSHLASNHHRAPQTLKDYKGKRGREEVNETKTPRTRRRGKTGESKGSHGVFSRASSHEFLINYGGGKEVKRVMSPMALHHGGRERRESPVNRTRSGGTHRQTKLFAFGFTRTHAHTHTHFGFTHTHTRTHARTHAKNNTALIDILSRCKLDLENQQFLLPAFWSSCGTSDVHIFLTSRSMTALAGERKTRKRHSTPHDRKWT